MSVSYKIMGLFSTKTKAFVCRPSLAASVTMSSAPCSAIFVVLMRAAAISRSCPWPLRRDTVGPRLDGSSSLEIDQNPSPPTRSNGLSKTESIDTPHKLVRERRCVAVTTTTPSRTAMHTRQMASTVTVPLKTSANPCSAPSNHCVVNKVIIRNTAKYSLVDPFPKLVFVLVVIPRLSVRRSVLIHSPTSSSFGYNMENS